MEKGSSSSSGSGSGSGSGTDSLNCLNFGKKIYFEGVDSRLQPKAGVVMLQSPAKRGRNGAVQSSQPPRCQVEGCQLDLSDAKAYYSRHKVCGMHSKSPKVIVGGLEQRFCQQCSRFHQLPEFDQVKRSCRRRLAGHNERRRKPPPGPFFSSHYRSLSDNYIKTGGLMMDFSSYSMSAGNTPSERGLGNQVTYNGKYLFPWQSSSLNPPPDLMQGSTATQPCYLGPGVPSEQQQFSGVSDSASALSLLSNQPWISTSQSSSLDLLGTNDAAAISQSSGNLGTAIGQFPFPWRGFKQNHAANALHEMPPDSGFDLTPHRPPGSSQYSGGHALFRPNDRSKYVGVKPSGGYDDCDDSVEHLQWSL